MTTIEKIKTMTIEEKARVLELIAHHFGCADYDPANYVTDRYIEQVCPTPPEPEWIDYPEPGYKKWYTLRLSDGKTSQHNLWYGHADDYDRLRNGNVYTEDRVHLIDQHQRMDQATAYLRYLQERLGAGRYVVIVSGGNYIPYERYAASQSITDIGFRDEATASFAIANLLHKGYTPDWFRGGTE